MPIRNPETADTELHWQPAWRLRELILEGHVSPREVVRSCLDRIDAHDDRLGCFLTVADDAALAAAESLEEKLRSGQEPGPLFGVPIAIKDQYPTAAIRTTAGSLTLGDYVPSVDADCVRRIRAADGIVIGKTNTPEFALFWRTRNRVAPETRNPWDPTRTPGGSSGGSAAAVAAGMVSVAVASDGGGSTRLPAAFCGVFGMLPTVGLVSNDGAIGGAPLFDRIGPIARDVQDAATVLAVLSGKDPRVPGAVMYSGPLSDELGNLHANFGWWHHPANTLGQDPRVLAMLRDVAMELTSLGGEVRDLGPLLDTSYTEAFHTISATDRFVLHGESVYRDPTMRPQLAPYTVSMFETATGWTSSDYEQALKVRARWMRKVDELLVSHDVLVSPTVAFVAPKLRDEWDWTPEGICAYTRLANFCGYPAVSVPVGFAHGLPIGLQLMAARGNDAMLVAVAQEMYTRGVATFMPHPPTTNPPEGTEVERAGRGV